MLKVGIVGATGYTGSELIKILLKHPEVEIASLRAKIDKPRNIEEIFPDLKDRISLECRNLERVEEVAAKVDLVFLALPHKVSMAFAPQFLQMGKKVIDLSADFRFENERVYEKWYNVQHTAKELLKKAAYGLPELYRAKIKEAALIANPGCYPTGAILGMAPLVKKKLVASENIIVDSKSGVSGAGRNPSLDFHYPECNENVKAYKISSHRHLPEIEQEISKLAGGTIKISFTPHLIPLNRGILSTIYLSLLKDSTDKEILGIYKEFYEGEPFVRILEEGIYPATKDVQGTNYCDIGFKVDSRTKRITIVSAIDNLVKGASGQAVQNMNIIYGFEEKRGLEG
jgi:N-acetyl-gamma-glutamyl-phosphate reductase